MITRQNFNYLDHSTTSATNSSATISILAIAVLLLTIAPTQSMAENPSNAGDAFFAPIEVLDGETAEQLKSEADGLFRDLKEEIEKMTSDVEAKKESKLSGRTLGNVHNRVQHLLRTARRLSLQGETAGVDYTHRGRQLGGALGVVIKYFRGSQKGRVEVHKANQRFPAQMPALRKQVAKIQKLIDAGNWEAAEQLGYKTADIVNRDYIILPSLAYGVCFEPLKGPLTTIEKKMGEIRSQEAHARHAKKYQELKPRFAITLSKLAAVTTSIGSTGKATWNEQELTGSQMIEAMGKEWRNAQAATLRCRSYAWLQASPTVSTAQFGPSGSADTRPQLTEVEMEFNSFTESLIAEMGKLITADANRVSVEEATQLYTAYLVSLSPIERLAGVDLETKLTPALQTFGEKSPKLKTAVANYDLATSELLRWRKRTATASAAARQTEYPALTDKNFQAMITRDVFVGLYPKDSNSPYLARLASPAPWLIDQGVKDMQDKKVQVADAVLISTKSDKLAGRYDKRVFTIFTRPADASIAAFTAQLRQDLMVTETAPPLTLKSAAAVETAARADLAYAGGKVTALYLESLLTRFGKMKNSAAVIIPYGSIPVEPDVKSPASHVLMRYDLQPEWACHEYGVIEMQGAGG